MRTATPPSAFLLGLLPALAACQDANSAESPEVDGAAVQVEEVAPRLPVGTSMTFRLDETVSTGTHEPGQEFTSRLMADAVDPQGRVVLPAGAVARWRILESTADNGEGEAVLAVGLVDVLTGEGWLPLEATVVASDLRTERRDSDAETAGKIGIGAAAGAVVGGVLGDDAWDALAGAGAGAALGTVVALSTRAGSATLPEGATLTVTLDQPLNPGGD